MPICAGDAPIVQAETSTLGTIEKLEPTPVIVTLFRGPAHAPSSAGFVHPKLCRDGQTAVRDVDVLRAVLSHWHDY